MDKDGSDGEEGVDGDSVRVRDVGGGANPDP